MIKGLGGELTVFDISGNTYRVVAAMVYDGRAVYVKHVFTHPEYDKWNKKHRWQYRRRWQKPSVRVLKGQAPAVHRAGADTSRSSASQRKPAGQGS